MAVLADRNAGFEGTVSTAQWAVLPTFSRYALMGAGDLQVTQGSGDRGLRVAAGRAWGDGVLSEFDTSTALQGLAVGGTGSRWDTVVVRRDWQSSTAELRLLAGGTAKAISTSRTTDAGATTSDQPLALVRFAAGSTVVQEIVDLRVWAGLGGALYARDVLALDYLTAPGTGVMVGDVMYVRTLDGAGNGVWSPLTQRQVGVRTFSTQTIAAGTTRTLSVTFPRPFTSAPVVQLGFQFAPGQIAGLQLLATAVSGSGFTIVVANPMSRDVTPAAPFTVGWTADV